MASGRLTRCSLKYSPQALQTGSPSFVRRHSDVCDVWQFEQANPTRLLALYKHQEENETDTHTDQKENWVRKKLKYIIIVTYAYKYCGQGSCGLKSIGEIYCSL